MGSGNPVAISPHPNPLLEGEGTRSLLDCSYLTHLRPISPDMASAVRFSNLAIVRASSGKRLWLAAAGIAIFIATVWTVHALVSRHETREPGFGLDFIAFYTAGTFTREGRLGDLYNLEAVHQFQRELATANHFDLGRAYGPWWNPPFYALVFEPLALLPYWTASAVWIGFNLFCFALACVLLCRLLPEKSPRHVRALIPVLTILSAPFILAISHAQNTCTSLLLLTLTVTLWRSRRAFLAGLVGGLMFYKPQVAAVLAIVLAIDLGWRAIAGYAITGAALLALNLIALPGTLTDYLQRLPRNVHSFQTGTAYPWEQHVTLKAFWRLLLQGHSLGNTTKAVTILSSISALAIALLLLAAAVRTRAATRSSEPPQITSSRRDRLIAATIVVTPLLMPFYFDYDLLLLSVPAVLFAAGRTCCAQDRLPSADRWIVGAWAILYVWQMVNADFGGKFHVNLSVLVLTGLASMLVVRVGRTRAATASDSDVVAVPARRAA